MKKVRQNILFILQSIVLMILFVLAISLERADAVSLFWQFYAAMILPAFIVILPGLFLQHRKKPGALFITFLLSIGSLHFLTLSPVKPFMLLQRDVTNGMTTQQVRQRFNQWFPENGRFRQPTLQSRNGEFDTRYLDQSRLIDTPDQTFHYFLDLTDGRYDAELLIVYFKNGRVVGAEYMSD